MLETQNIVNNVDLLFLGEENRIEENSKEEEEEVELNV